MLSRPKLIGEFRDQCNVSYIAPTGARLVLAMGPGVETPGYGCLAPPEHRNEAPICYHLRWANLTGDLPAENVDLFPLEP